MIEVSEATIVYGSGRARLEAVRNASFKIGNGEIFGLVGESGSGKSTLLRGIAGLVPLAEGSITVAGHQIDADRKISSRKLVQMVFQDPYGSLNPAHTVDKILSEPLMVQGLGSIEQRVEKCLHEVGLGPQHRYRYPHQISGGQRQRVAIARALITEPPVLLLDEPTSALDLSVQAEILNLLKSVSQRRNLTMLMVSHDLAVISHMCMRIAVMYEGRIIEILSVEKLRNREATHSYTNVLLNAALQMDQRKNSPPPLDSI